LEKLEIIEKKTLKNTFHCRIICWQPVYFRSFSFVCILHICVLWDQQACHACLLCFAGVGGIVKILFLIQWQWKPYLTYLNCHCTKNRIFTIPPAPVRRSKQAWQTCSVDPKAHKYVEYRQKRNSWNKPAVNKWYGNETFGDECKSLLYSYLYSVR